MSGRGNLRSFLGNVCGIAYVPHTCRLRSAYVLHTLPHTLPHTLTLYKALQGVCFDGVAMIIPLFQNTPFFRPISMISEKTVIQPIGR